MDPENDEKLLIYVCFFIVMVLIYFIYCENVATPPFKSDVESRIKAFHENEMRRKSDMK